MIFKDIYDSGFSASVEVLWGYTPRYKPSWKFIETSSGFHAGIDRTEAEDKHYSSFTIKGSFEDIYAISALLNNDIYTNRTFPIELECLHDRVFGIELKPLSGAPYGIYEVNLVSKSLVRRDNESFYAMDIELQLVDWDKTVDSDTLNLLSADSDQYPLISSGYTASVETARTFNTPYELTGEVGQKFSVANTTTNRSETTSEANQAWLTMDKFNGATIELSMTVNDYWFFVFASDLRSERFAFHINDYIADVNVKIGELYDDKQYEKLSNTFPIDLSYANNGYNSWTIRMALKATSPK